MTALIPLLIALALSAPKAAPASTKREKRRITKASVYLVKSPSFLAPRCNARLLRGADVDVEPPATQGWFLAWHGSHQDYLHQSYVADRAIAFQISDRNVSDESVISGNYNLAVGGFSEGAEGHLRKKNSDDKALERGYQWIDGFLPVKYTERSAMIADPAELKAFVESGRLREPGLTEAQPTQASADAAAKEGDAKKPADVAPASGGGSR